jgi:hypothetical protein
MFNKLLALLRTRWTDATNWAAANPALIRTCLWLFFTLIGGVLPTWGAVIIFALIGQSLTWSLFVSHGEFALYSASLIAPMFYTLTIDRPAGFPYRGWFTALGLALLTFAAIIFVVTVLAAQGALVPRYRLNEAFLIVSSLVGYAFTVTLVYFVTMLDMLNPPANLLAVRAEQEAELARQFHRERGD